MNALQINYFLHLCKTLNITETSRQLYVAQPSISKQIARLEKELGYPLFYRTNRGLTLTEAGRIMHDFFKKASRDFQSADHKARRTMDKKQRPVVIGVLEFLGLDELQEFLHVMHEKNPDQQISIVRLNNSELMSRLAARRIDIALTFDHAVDSDVIEDKSICHEELLLEESAFIITKNHPLASKEHLTPADLSGEVMCQTWMGKENSDQYLYSLLKLLDIQPLGYLTVENLASGLEAIEANFAVGLVDERIQLVNTERYVMIPTGTFQSIVAIWRKEDQEDLQDFLRELKAVVGQN